MDTYQSLTASAASARTKWRILKDVIDAVNEQVVAGLKSLLNSGGTTAISGDVSYTTALAFVQALGRSQDSKDDTYSVSPLLLLSCFRYLLAGNGSEKK